MFSALHDAVLLFIHFILPFCVSEFGECSALTLLVNAAFKA